MRGFSKKECSYDSYASEAIQAIRSDDGVRAQELAAKAYDLAPNPSERARMARDIGNACRHQGDYDEAKKWAAEAVEQHQQLVEETPNRSTLRELGASTAMLATIEFSQLLRIKEADVTPSEDDKMSAIAQNYRTALDAIIESRQHAEGLNRRVDQYEINFTARASFAETLTGNRRRGLTLGARAAYLAGMSESPRLDTTDETIDKKERYKMKTLALVRGLGALAAGVIEPINRNAAKKIARKLI